MAVRCDQHSVRLGQRASSQTVATWLAPTTRRVNDMPAVGSGRFNHGGRRRPGGTFDEQAFDDGRTGSDDKGAPFCDIPGVARLSQYSSVIPERKADRGEPPRALWGTLPACTVRAGCLHHNSLVRLMAWSLSLIA